MSNKLDKDGFPMEEDQELLDMAMSDKIGFALLKVFVFIFITAVFLLGCVLACL